MVKRRSSPQKKIAVKKETKVVSRKKSVSIKKEVKPSPRQKRKVIEKKAKVPVEEKSYPTPPSVLMKKLSRIQTAEGWKRSQLRKLKLSKGAKS